MQTNRNVRRQTQTNKNAERQMQTINAKRQMQNIRNAKGYRCRQTVKQKDSCRPIETPIVRDWPTEMLEKGRHVTRYTVTKVLADFAVYNDTFFQNEVIVRIFSHIKLCIGVIILIF